MIRHKIITKWYQITYTFCNCLRHFFFFSSWSRRSSLSSFVNMLLKLLFLSLIIANCYSLDLDDSKCDCEQVFSNLNFVNYYSNELEEDIFYKKVEPRKFNDNKEILYFNDEVSNLIGLKITKEMLDSIHCKNEILEYLSFEKLIPNSYPISIPQSE